MKSSKLSSDSGGHFHDGLEWFGPPDDRDCQCARCGSSVGWDHYGGMHFGKWLCVSSADYCESNPLPGRENVRGAR